METGRFSDWQSERDPSENSEPKPESDKKKKRRRGEADSARARRIAAALESEAKAPETTERRRAQKALADIFVERGTEAEPKRSGRAKSKEFGEVGISSGQAGKLEADEHNRKAAASVSERAGTEESESARKAEEHTTAEQLESDERERNIPRPEREHLRPGELYGGEFVIDLQDNKSSEEREIPLHETPAAEVMPVVDERLEVSDPEPALQVSREAEKPVAMPEKEAEPERAETPAVIPEAAFEPSVPPVFRHPAEQPGQARVFEVPPPGEFIPTASSHGPENPAGSIPEADPAASIPEGFEAVPAASAVRHTDPADMYPMYMHQPAPRVVNGSGSGEQMVTRQQADNEVYYAARAAQGRGVAAGFLFAALWARHRGKKLRRHFNELLGKQEKELKQTREDQRFYAAEQARKQDETNRQLAAAEQRYTYAERKLANGSQPEAQFAAGVSPERRFAANGAREATPASPEVIAHMQKNQQVARPELAPQNVPEQLNVPPEHRLETSAWHTIEVDARTGRPVEQPTFAYGHEYYQERKHESAPADQRNAVAGEVALVGAAVAGSRSGGAGSGPAGAGSGSTIPSNIPSASMQGPPPGSPTAKVRDARTNLTKATSSGPIWPLVVALLVIFVFLIVLLH